MADIKLFITKVLSNLDANTDGKVTKEEVAAAFKKAGLADFAASQGADKFMADGDVDGSGSVSGNEFGPAVLGMLPGGAAMFEKSLEAMGKDGKIDLKAFTAYVNKTTPGLVKFMVGAPGVEAIARFGFGFIADKGATTFTPEEGKALLAQAVAANKIIKP